MLFDRYGGSIPVSEGAFSSDMTGIPVAKKSMTVAKTSALSSFHSTSSSSCG